MNRWFARIGTFIQKWYLAIIIMTLILIVPAIFGAMEIEMESGTETLISKDTQVYKDFDRFNQSFSGDVIANLITGDDISQLLLPENVRAMELIEDQMSANPGVVSAVGPAFLIKQAMAAQTGTPVIPDDPQLILGIVTDPETGTIRKGFSGVIPTSEHAVIAIVIDARITDEAQREVIEEIEMAATDAAFTGVEVIVTGQPVLSSELEDVISQTLGTMLIVAIVLMLAILALVFSVRNFFAWRWLPLGIVLISIIYAFGVMGVLTIPMTMVTMASFPILIGIGIDYAIQFHNRYDEETRRGGSVGEAVIDFVTHIGPSIRMTSLLPVSVLPPCSSRPSP